MILTLFYLIHAIIGLIDFVILTLFLFTLSFLPDKLRGTWFPHLVTYWFHVFIRALRVDLFIHEKNQRPLPKQYIVIGNHPSCFEDIGILSAFKVKFLAKKEVRNWFLVGRLSYVIGTLYVDRECKNSRSLASDSLLEALKSGESIGIYPEGGCKGRRIHTPFRYGVFDLSIKANVPVLPIFLHYEAQEKFEWQNQHLLHKLWTIFTAPNRRVNYYVYDAIYPSQFNSKEEYCEFVEQLYLDWQKRYLD
tara:strand:- start:78379 stop:79125 length:747 start_codon:yes stop_codon:yes gene_type:complete